MARLRILDYLQTYPFWLADISMTPLPVFLPTLGFSAITAPQMSLDIAEIKEGNWPFRRKVVGTGATVDQITLSRGVQLYDQDFWKWILATCTGDRQQLSGLFTGAVTNLLGGSTRANVRKNLVLIHFTGYAPLVSLPKVPGKAYILHGCLPSRYKVGSDFSAASGEVSVAELDIQFEYFEEFGLGLY